MQSEQGQSYKKLHPVSLGTNAAKHLNVGRSFLDLGSYVLRYNLINVYIIKYTYTTRRWL